MNIVHVLSFWLLSKKGIPEACDRFVTWLPSILKPVEDTVQQSKKNFHEGCIYTEVS